MKARVDAELCACYGICVDICPEVFELNEDSAKVERDTVPAKYEEACVEAARLCPMKAISVEE